MPKRKIPAREAPQSSHRARQQITMKCVHITWKPHRKARPYHRARAEWVGDYVHESLRVNGSVAELHADLLHFTCDSLSEHLRTVDLYTTLAAQ